MPLRDHFRPPLSDRRSWEVLHGGWPMTIATALNARLPVRYVAGPQVHLGASIEVDVATFDENESIHANVGEQHDEGGVAIAVWAPPRPTLTVATDLGDLDEYEVRVYDTTRGLGLVAAVEIVSPANKDRPEHRRAFVAKCAALLQARVSLAIVDLVTTRSANLYAELMDFLGEGGPLLADGPPDLYAVACRWTKENEAGRLETWSHPLAIGGAMPTLPLWLASDLAVPLELELSYEEACRALRIP